MICCLITINTQQQQIQDGLNSSEIIAFFTCYFIGISLVYFPISTAITFIRNRHRLEDEEFKDKYGFLYENLKPKIGSVLYNHAFILRRLIYALSLVMLKDLPSVQLIIHGCTSMLYTSYLLVAKPFKDRNDNKKEIFNEIMLLILSDCYNAFLFADDMISIDSRDRWGWVYISIFTFLFLVNIQRLFKKFIFEIIPKVFKNLK
jgi:hypothetical protein